MGAIYLIHFTEPIEYRNRLFGDTQHYVGLTDNLRDRLMQHANNRGSWVTKAAIRQRKGLIIGGIFDDEDYSTRDETGLAMLCETFCYVCNPEGNPSTYTDIRHEDIEGMPIQTSVVLDYGIPLSEFVSGMLKRI